MLCEPSWTNPLETKLNERVAAVLPPPFPGFFAQPRAAGPIPPPRRATAHPVLRFAHALASLLALTALLWAGMPVLRAGAGVEVGVGTTASDQLQESLRLAMEHNEELAAAEAQLRATMERERQSGVLPDPMLSLQYYLEPVQTRTGPQEAALGISQMLPWPGKLALREQEARVNTALARSRYLVLRQKIAARVKAAHVEYGFNAKAQQIAGQNLALFKYMEQVAATRYAGGEASYGDILKIQIETAKLEDRIATLTEQAVPLRIKLNNLLGLDARAEREPPAALPEPVLLAQPPDLARLAIDNNPDLQGAEEAVKLAGVSLELARRDFYPDFTVSLRTIFTGDSASNPPDNGKDPVIGGVNLNVPIFRERRNAALAEKNALLLAGRKHKQQLLRNLTNDLEEQLFQYKESRRRRRLYAQTLIPKARQGMEVMLQAFQAGQVSSMEPITVQRDLLELELAENRARADQALAVARLEELAGTTLADWTDEPDHNQQLNQP